MIFPKHGRMFVGSIPLENNEPIVVLRAGDPAANEALAAYLNQILAEENSSEFAHDVLDLIFRFKRWQTGHEPPTEEVQADAGLADSVKATMGQKSGFCRRSVLLNKYRIPPFHLDRILARLGVREFRIATPGRPASFYVLPEAVGKFHRHAVREGWTILTSGIFDKKDAKDTRATGARKTASRGG